jgi:integrase
LADGRNPNAERKAKRAAAMTVKEAFDDFFDRRSLAVNSLGSYSRTRDLYLKDWLAKPIGEITRQMVLDRHRKISQDNGPATANGVFRHFRAVRNLTEATHGDLPPNPVAILSQARAWNPERRRRNIIPPHGMPRWWAAVHQEDDLVRDFLLVALFSGMRRSEVAGLRWDYIDLEGGLLRLPTTKNGDPLELPLSYFLCNLLLSRRDNDPEGEWVFPGRGATGHIVEAKSICSRVAKASGIRFSMHDLRRTFITIAESLDTPFFALKRLINHRTDSDITGGYIVLGTERLRRPVECIAEHILELCNACLTSVREAA